MKHIRKFESHRNRRRRDEIIKESVLQVNDIYKVRTMVDIPQSLINSYVKKVKDVTGKNVRQFFGDVDIAEEIVKWVNLNFLNVDQVPAGALTGDAQGQPEVVQGQAQAPVQGQAQGQAQAQAPVQGQAQGQAQAQAPVQGQAQGQAQVQGQAQGQVQAQGQAQPEAQVQVQTQAQGQGQGEFEEVEGEESEGGEGEEDNEELPL